MPGSGRAGFGLNGPVAGTAGADAAPRIEPKVDTGALDRLHQRADEARQELQQLGATTATPQVGTGPVDALIAKIGQAIGMLGQLDSRVAAANAGIASVNAGAIRARSGTSFSDGVTAGAGP